MSRQTIERKQFEDQIAYISKCMKRKLEHKRYLHSISVAYTASCIAMRFGYNPHKAYLAGLLHDNAKGIPHDKKLTLCTKYGLTVNMAEKDNQDLLHAKLGSYLAKEKYNINEEEILSAILYHTTGRPNMTLLEKIIYIADYIELYRKPLPNMDKIREMAFIDLDACVLLILENILSFLQERGYVIDDITISTYEYYKQVALKGEIK